MLTMASGSDERSRWPWLQRLLEFELTPRLALQSDIMPEMSANYGYFVRWTGYLIKNLARSSGNLCASRLEVVEGA